MDNYFSDNNSNIALETEDLGKNSSIKNRTRVAIIDELEIVQTGFANAVAEGFPLSENEKLDMINEDYPNYSILVSNHRNDPMRLVRYANKK